MKKIVANVVWQLARARGRCLARIYGGRPGEDRLSKLAMRLRYGAPPKL